jgi:ferredoxin
VSALSTMKHADGCKVVRENGIAVWMCVGTCPAMFEFVRSGQVDDQPWDQLDRDQRETVIDAVSNHAIGALDERDKEGR